VIVDRFRSGVQGAAFAASVLRSTRVGRQAKPKGLVSFARAAVGQKFGPHLAIMLHAHLHGDKECLVEPGPTGVRRFTYREFDDAANRLAHALVARGVSGGDRVAIMLPNGSEYLIAQAALPRIGATAVQIGYRLKASEVAYILGNAEPRAALVHADFAETFLEARKEAGQAGAVLVTSGGGPSGPVDPRAERWDDAVKSEPGDRPPRVAGTDSGGVIVYTSGTTGKPKGATRNWKQTGLEAVADMMLQVGMRADDRHLVVCPLYHSAAPAFVAMMMALGATTVLMNHFDPEGALALIERERITCSLMVPTMLVRLNALPPEVIKKYDTSSLRWVMSGAAPLATDTARRFQELFGPILWNFYGATETGLVTLAGPPDHVSRPGTIGRAVRGNEIRLLDENGGIVPPGGIGELYARNSMLIAGYHRNRDATRSSMRDGFFSVGDLGRSDHDGFYYLESRKHDMVISGGVNIYPREIEDQLHTHPDIHDVAVVGVPDPEWGETLRAYVVRRAGAELSEADVIAWARQGLADYKRPRQVVFLDELPRNPTGKILKRELKAL
jgi:fatty-acyl-CoA synthase